MGTKKPDQAESLRRARRRERLKALKDEVGSITQIASDTGTPRSHFSAILAGRRGVGDDLAAKLERRYAKPAGWFDQAEGPTVWPFSPALGARVQQLDEQDLLALENSMRAFLRMPVVIDTPTDEAQESEHDVLADLVEPLRGTPASAPAQRRTKGT